MESFETNESSETYLERAVESNQAFLAELDSCETLEELRNVLDDLAYVTKVDGEYVRVLPEVTEIDGVEDATVEVYQTEDIIRSLGVFIADPVTEREGLEQEVQNWIPHRDVAQAVIRIISKKLDEKEAA